MSEGVREEKQIKVGAIIDDDLRAKISMFMQMDGGGVQSSASPSSNKNKTMMKPTTQQLLRVLRSMLGIEEVDLQVVKKRPATHR